MGPRLLVCLPFCLLLAPGYPNTSPRYESEQVGKGDLAGRDPVVFVRKCLEHYDRQIEGYSLTMRKRERIGGKLNPREVIDIHFKDRPHSVFFDWVVNPRKAQRVLYVAGQNNDQLLVLPAGALRILGVVVRDVDSEDARQSGRYPITEFGLRKAMQRVAINWKKAQDAKALHVEYLGIHKVPEAGNRPCHKFRRTKYAHPEDDGVTELILYIDTEHLLQVGSILKDENGELIGEYYFSNIKINPPFRANQFERAALTAKS
ncbi:MAG: DUF1571 domain-containing protein [Gemmataceae bacterium]|nr:DUF1571 domain-containing protein [Gemmataceae bacterium]